MKRVLESPWATIALLIASVSMGYALYLHRHGGLAKAASYFCPAQQICDSDACQAEGACSEENCTHCPRCKNGASS